MRELLPFVRLFRPHLAWVLVGSLLGLVTAAAGFGLLSLSGWFISATAIAGMSTASAQVFDFFRPGAGVRFFAITRTVGRYGERVVSHEATFRLLASLRVWFYRRIEPLAPAQLMGYRSGDLLNRVVADIDALDNLYLRVLSPGLVALVMSLAVPAFLWFFDPWIAAVAFTCMWAVGLLVPLVSARLGAEPGRDLARATASLRVRIVEGVQGLPELLLFGAHRRHLGAVAEENRALLRAQESMSRVAGLSAGLVTLTTGLAAWMALYLGVGLVNRQALADANLALVVLAVLAAFEAVMALPLAFQYLGRTRAAARRLLEVVASEPAVVFPREGGAAPSGNALSLESVAFRYRDGAPLVLQDLDLAVAEGTRQAILGPTGSGKSTLANLLVRFWDPTAGRILIGGQDLRAFSEDELRRRVAVVSQRTHLFNASLRDNLRLARPGAGDGELLEALATARLLEFVEALPEGLDTWLGEQGAGLSGGQARRLAVARALLRDAPILILDEPTEGLDAVTEREMMAALGELMAGRSVLLITHRLVGLEEMDAILVLERGRVVEQGSHSELMTAGGRYAAMRTRLLAPL